MAVLRPNIKLKILHNINKVKIINILVQNQIYKHLKSNPDSLLLNIYRLSK